MTKKIPIATPINESCVIGANGNLYINSKVKTYYIINEIGKWYTGKITEIHKNNKCSIQYDEGFSIIGNANVVYLTEPVINAKIIKYRAKSTRKCIPFLNFI